MANLKIAILNVGHGDFSFIRTPLGNDLVIDCGSDSGDITPSKFLAPIKKIDELQISHPHIDHFDDIVALSTKTICSFRCPSLNNFTDNVIGGKNNDATKIAQLKTLYSTIAPNNNAIVCNTTFSHSVYCPTNVDYGNPNTASLVTIFKYASFKILFGGDLPDSGWCNLLKDDNFKVAISGVNIFKVPHHGRKEGRSEELFKHISPDLCIISDKSIDDTNKSTVATDWYSKRSKGAIINGATEKRKVLSTRNDGSIFINVSDTGSWSVYPNTSWQRD